jgi:hypothetical protein
MAFPLLTSITNRECEEKDGTTTRLQVITVGNVVRNAEGK